MKHSPLKRPARFSALAATVAALTLSGCVVQNYPAGSAPLAASPQTVSDGMSASMQQADADMLAVLDAHRRLNALPIESLTPEQARQQSTLADAVLLLKQERGISTAPEGGLEVRNITYQGAQGPLPARVYIPSGVDRSQLIPVVLYFHGGGWVLADLDDYDASARALAKRSGAVVISAHYRQAPEHPFPAAHEDAFAAYKWALQNVSRFGGDSKRIAVAGESAGANLAINTSIAARKAGLPVPVYQVLVYPVAGTDFNTPSYQEHAYAKPLNRAMMDWFMGHVTSSEAQRLDPRLNLVGTANLQALPATTLITADIDPLQSEGSALAGKLQMSGVRVNYKNYEGVTHEFFGMAPLVAKATDAQIMVGNDLKNAFITVKNSRKMP
jgi:acetyl esterase/lipase